MGSVYILQLKVLFFIFKISAANENDFSNLSWWRIMLLEYNYDTL